MTTSFELQTSHAPRPSDGLPGIIYKYRNWAAEYNRRILTHREIYFSSADDFNDPFDSKFPIRYDLLEDEELRQRLVASYRRGVPQAPPAEVDREVAKAFANLRTPGYLSDLDDRKYAANNKVVGVFSLTTQPSNILMWSHYANAHRGFVVGFDTDALFEDISCTLLPVSYQQDYPTIMPGLGSDEGPIELLNVYGTKSSLWSYEDEIRMFKMYAAKKAFAYQPTTLREIILGCKISDAHRDEILQVAQGFPQVKIYQAAMSRTAFALDIQLVR